MGFINIVKKYPKIFIDWHPTWNGRKSPNMIYLNNPKSKKKYWWRCHKTTCRYIWKDSIPGRIKFKRGCPQCEMRAKTKKVKDIYGIIKKTQKIENLINKTDDLFYVMLDENNSNYKKIRTSVIIRHALLEIQKTSDMLKKAITNQKNFSINELKLKK